VLRGHDGSHVDHDVAARQLEIGLIEDREVACELLDARRQKRSSFGIAHEREHRMARVDEAAAEMSPDETRGPRQKNLHREATRSFLVPVIDFCSI
jgi:hypothetical protein